MWYTRLLYLNGVSGVILSIFMLIPMLVAYVLGEERAFDAFFTGLLLAGLCASSAMMGFRGSAVAPRRAAGIILPVSACLTAAVITGMPFYFFQPELGLLRALVQGIALVSTSGGDFYFSLERLPTSFHVWRAITAWLGGFAAIVMILAIYTLLNHGGVRLHRTALVFGESRPGMSRLRSLSLAIAPFYISVTAALVLTLFVTGTPLATALLFAAGAISGTGLNIETLTPAGNSWTLLILSLGMLVAIGNWDSMLARVTGRSGRRALDPEIRSIFILSAVAVLILGLMGGFGQQPVDRILFLVASALSGTGWVPAETRDYVTALPVALILLMLAVIGGAATGPSGGIKQVRMMVLTQLGRKEMKRLAYPHGVMPLKVAGARVSERDVTSIWLLVCASAICVVVGILIFAGMGRPAADSFYLAVTAITLSGPFVEVLSPGFSGFYALSNVEMGVIGALNLIGRVEASVFFALFVTQLWRA